MAFAEKLLRKSSGRVTTIIRHVRSARVFRRDRGRGIRAGTMVPVGRADGWTLDAAARHLRILRRVTPVYNSAQDTAARRFPYTRRRRPRS